MGNFITRRDAIRIYSIGTVGLVLGEGAVLTGAIEAAEAAANRPGKVTGVKVTKVGTYSAKVSWRKATRASKYSVALYRNGKCIAHYSTTKCAYYIKDDTFFEALNPNTKYQVRVQAIDKNWNSGKWSNKIAFTTKNYKVVRYEFTGEHSERGKCPYKFKYAEFRDYYGAGQHGIVVLYYTAVNNSYEDWDVYQPWYLYAYQNGIKLGKPDFFNEEWGLSDPPNETIAPGYELDGYIAFSLRDNTSPIVIHSEPITSDNGVTYAFEKTLNLI